ncbi:MULTISPECIES: indolepyruvate oxidoreductase subunit beta [unclassified Methanosarcina]|uniref:indolepyruvate oxidoreductase subunit beta n=1 Tax=unclassified Methanosarcina TaxID=2644672 RepID=UPI00064EAF89|nr:MULTISPECIES: indolepyruvate oxidoreductase subunit beta [unclassified Methanosarcina]
MKNEGTKGEGTKGEGMKYDILIAGVGGQGVVLASRMLALAAMKAGFRVSTAETIGMSQREGSVSSHIRIGDEIPGSLIPAGQADLLIGLEPAETVRNLPFLKKDGKIIVNSHAIPPASKPPGSPEYDPAALLAFLEAHVQGILCLDFTQLAEEAGTYRAANVAMLGAAAGTGMLPFSREIILAVLETEIPEKHRAVNRAAFEGAIERIKLIPGQPDGEQKVKLNV